MDCKSITLKGINLGCKDNMGGIKTVYLIEESGIEATALDPTGSQIASITLKATPELQPAVKFKTYRFRKGTSSMTSTSSTDDAAGNFMVTTELALQFSKMETSKRLEIMGMCLADMVAIVEDFNGVMWYLGYDFPITATAATGNTGTALSDYNGYNVTITDMSKEFPFALSPEAVTAFKDQVDPAPIA